MSGFVAVISLRPNSPSVREETRVLTLVYAYPRGKHNAIVRRAAAAAGYSRAFALPENTEIVGPHSLPRVGIFPGDGIASLRVKTDPAYLRVRHSPIFPVLRSMARGRA